MSLQAISFVDASDTAASDPNRMDIAMFVGFLPLREGADAVAARSARSNRLSVAGWADRIAGGSDILDVPVRVRSLDEVERLFDTGARQDRSVLVSGAGIAAVPELVDTDRSLTLSLDGTVQHIDLAAGPLTRNDIVDQLQAGLDAASSPLSVSLGVEASGFAPLIFTLDGPGDLTVYANPSLGFPVARRSASARVCSPMGAALRLFFASGGREAVIVRMGDPVPYFADEPTRVSALQTLIGGGYGSGANSFGDLMAAHPSDLPPSVPSRTPWHGLAHLHGLSDVSLVMLPDMSDLLASEPPLVFEPGPLPRPREVFTICAPEDTPSISGEARLAQPMAADADGLEIWSRLTAWATEQTARITPEAMVVAAPPWTGDSADTQSSDPVKETIANGNRGQGLSHPQLQLVWPWITAPSLRDAPARAAPAVGLLAGMIASDALTRGAWRSVAGTPLPEGYRPYGGAPGLSPFDVPTLSLIGFGLRGPTLLSDHTPAPEPYTQAHIRRLMALILRASRHRGEADVFEPNGQALWRSVSMTMTTLLRQLYSAGALRGASEAEAFTVRCGPSTMSQADIDAGRVIAEIAVLPAASLERIEIRLICASQTGPIQTEVRA